MKPTPQLLIARLSFAISRCLPARFWIRCLGLSLPAVLTILAWDAAAISVTISCSTNGDINPIGTQAQALDGKPVFPAAQAVRAKPGIQNLKTKH